ncbi:hypothetical protein KP003_16610 [Geomonas nitrogeniifigens]|uniref:host specificity factor TipJ family phage tail protein n=1 Tax=Geomonas diazotrophica TaxID=2843197 RepID=UPI001C2C6E38|nr:host specificity factor TipJ family phage tail protein [Geomonas nitrogeniifigens]QXE85963.1 hypothetical protein KP003_16610 [Geomonas nitrogeniifigens]
MIRIYASKIDGVPVETHDLHGPMTVESWLRSKAPSYQVRKSPPVSVEVHGCIVDPELWDEFTLYPYDDVTICVEPKGMDPITITYLTYKAANAVMSSLITMPTISQGKKQRSGDSVIESTAKANAVKLNSVIREIAGTFKVYPDYLLPPHLYFTNKKYQWSEMLLCVGKGEYDIPAETVLVGNTRFSALGVDADYQIFPPGADLSGVTMAQWWHTASEVGLTSAGRAGLELNAEFTGDSAATASSYQFDGNTISIPAGAGFFPAGWTAGMILMVYEKQTFDVIEGWADPDVIKGDFTTLQPFVGMKIEIAGDNAGEYVIATYDSVAGTMTLSYDDNSQVNGLLTGSQRMSIAYRGSKYEITYVQTDTNGKITAVEVNRLTDADEVDLTWGGFTFAITNDAVVKLDGSGIEGGWAGPFPACPYGEVTDTVEYDVMFPQGLCLVNSSGVLQQISVKLELQWRDINGVSWTSVQKTYTGKTVDQIAYTETLSLPASIRPEIRMRRVGAKSTNLGARDVVQWYGLKCKLSAPSSYAGVTTIAVKIRGGDRLAAQADKQISVKATRRLPARIRGAWTEPVATRSIEAWACYVLKSMGYTDADIDLVSMDALAAVCAFRGDFYDFSVESQSTVKGELANAFRAGFAEMTLDRGKIRPVRDQIHTVYEHMYSPQNMVEPLQRSFAMLRPDDFDGVDVEYVDSTTWAKETVECRLPGDLGMKVEKIAMEGVTDRTRAWRIGMRRRRMHRYRRWTYGFSTELDALNSRYFSFCALGDDVPGYGQSAILLEYLVGNTVALVSSEPLRWVDGQSHVIAIRRQDGTLSGPYPATRISETIAEVPAIDFEPDTSWQTEPPHLLFGTTTRWSYPVLVASINHGGDNTVSVEAVNYDERVYADDDNAPG